MRSWTTRASWRLMTLATGSMLLLTGCDDTTRATVENGIITSSSSLLAAVFRAVLEVAIEGADTAS